MNELFLHQCIRDRLQRMDRAVRAVGMVYAAWFYMRFYCPRIVVRAGPRMCPRELAFWREHIFLRSLGEFYFVNKLDFRNGVELVWEGAADGGVNGDDHGHGHGHERAATGDQWAEGGWWETRKPKGVLVPLGGGKDSLLAFEVLKRTGVRSIPSSSSVEARMMKMMRTMAHSLRCNHQGRR